MRKLLALLVGLFLGSSALAQSNVPGSAINYSSNSNLTTVTNGGQYLATLSFMQWCASTGVVCTSGDQTTNLQNFYLAAALLRAQLIGSGNFAFTKVPTGASQTVMAYVEPYVRVISSPVVVPEGVETLENSMLYRNSTVGYSGSCSGIWWDGSSCGALTNLFQPMFIGAWGSHIDNAYLYAKNGDGTNNGSGYSRRVWEIGAIQNVSGLIGVGGSGYQNGEIGYLANPGMGGGVPTQVTLAVSGGAITGATMVSGVRFAAANGGYTLPPVLQDRLYSQAAFIAATGVTTFMTDGTSSTGCYIVTGQTSGAHNGCVRVQWFPDWCSGTGGGSGDSQYIGGTNCALSTTYEGQYNTANQAEVGKTDNINVYSAGTSTGDAQYGSMWSSMTTMKNTTQTGQDTTLGGYYGKMIGGIDYRGNILNPVQMPVGIWMKNGQQHINMAVVDSPSANCADIGSGATSTTSGQGGGIGESVAYMECFVNGGSPAISGYALDAGTLPTSGMNGLYINATLTNLGGTAALYADYWQSGNQANINLENLNSGGNPDTNVTPLLVTFGTHNKANGGNLITGSGDDISGSVFSGTWPTGFGAWWWDAYANGFLAGNGAYVMWGAGAPTNGTTGANKAIQGSTYYDTTNGVAYIQTTASSSPTWVKLASNLQDVQTFTSTATWTKPSFCTGSTKCSSVITAIGGGGSGGGGAMETLGTVGTGGGGGGSGECVVVEVATADLGATQTATVATTSTGGLGATVAGPGADGTQGSNSFFSTFVTAYGGGRGGGGQTAASSGGGGGAGINAQGGNATGTTAGAVVGSYSVGGGTAANGPQAQTGGQFRPGAGGGGSSVTVAFNGGPSMCAGGGGSGGTLLSASAVNGGTGGLSQGITSGTTAQGGTSASSGTAGTGGAAVPVGGLSWGLGASGSGGGGANTGGAGGVGGGAGTATYGFGGGGGGAGTTAGGNGGIGGAGFIAVVTTGQ